MIPDPLSIITDGVNAVAGWSWDQVAEGISRWVLEALTAPIDRMELRLPIERIDR